MTSISWIQTGYRKYRGWPTRHSRPQLTALLLSFSLAAVAGPVRLQAQAAPAAAPPSRDSHSKVKELHVSAAAGMAAVMPAFAHLYEQKTGIRLIVTAGTSSRQVDAIEKGSKQDIFLGADFTYPEKLVAAGLTDAKAPIAYAKNALVLFARKDSPLQPLTLDTLRDPRIQSLAVADPLQSPTGRAAAAALTRLKLAPTLQPKLRVSENVEEAGREVESGKAQLGLISLSLASSAAYKQVGRFAEVPESQYPEMRLYAVVLRNGNTSAAHAFLNWILSSDIQGQLPQAGLRPLQ